MASGKRYGYSTECCFLPVGALTSKFYAFTSRPWELKFLDSFDPTNEFYIPLKLGVQDFKIKKVLPVNKFVPIYSYNWVSNRTRVFFDSLGSTSLISSPRFYGVECSWFYCLSFIARTSFLFNRVRNLYLLDSENYDLYSIFKISSFNSKFGSKPNLSTTKFVKVKNFSNVFTRLIELSNLRSLNFLRILELSYYNTSLELEYSSQPFSHIFVIGHNPYFFNPVFFNRLRKGAERGRFAIYTFLCTNFPLSFKFTNSFPNIKSLESFFSGRHYTNKFLTSSSVLVLDCNFISRFDSKLWVVFKVFLERNPFISVYICGLGELNVSQFRNFLDFRFFPNLTGTSANFWFKHVNYFFGSLLTKPSNVVNRGICNINTSSVTEPFSFDASVTGIFKDLNIFFSGTKDSSLLPKCKPNFGTIILPLSRFLEFESYFRGNFFSRIVVNQKVFPYSVGSNRWLGSIFYGLESRLLDFSRYFIKFRVFYFWYFFALFFLGFDFSLNKGFSFGLPFRSLNGFSTILGIYYTESSYAAEFFDYGWLGLSDQKFSENGVSRPIKFSFFSPFYSVFERVGFVSDSYGSRFMSLVESKYFYNFSNFKSKIF